MMGLDIKQSYWNHRDFFLPEDPTCLCLVNDESMKFFQRWVLPQFYS
jgi:hypothetical protein